MRKEQLFLAQCIRTTEVRACLLLLLVLGFISILIGQRYLTAQQEAIAEVSAYQDQHHQRHMDLHNDDIGLLLYYVKFAIINSSNPLSGISIGQADINPTVKRITIKTFEAQKHDTDLVNPMNLQSGNFDLAFVIIYLLPLMVIVLSFNLISEETETGTWQLVVIQSKSKLGFVLTKLLVRLMLILLVLIILFFAAKLLLAFPLDGAAFTLLGLAILYVIFWFSLSFFVICFKCTSGFNALLLLSIWLVLVILVPSAINSYVSSKYPMPEALSTSIAQRDGYHTKWDTDKLATIEKFYKHYPQFKEYGYPTDGFSWLWYYAMQQMGDDESQLQQQAMDTKLKLREKTSRTLASWLPNMHLQLAFNDLAGTSSKQHIDFLDATEAFHEELRLFFYPTIFQEQKADSIDWTQFQPRRCQSTRSLTWLGILSPLIIFIVLMVLAAIPKAIKL